MFGEKPQLPGGQVTTLPTLKPTLRVRKLRKTAFSL